jgi:16S rRNA (guanine966-N2)-methyltransferase
MRIISGRFARRKLRSPSGHLTRPTTDRAREAIFNLLGSRIFLDDITVLDLFAGTGALGLEAISRGAAHVIFVENNGRVLQFARENAEELEVEDRCVFMRSDAVSYLENYSGPTFDVIFADPPYDLEAMERMPDMALEHLASAHGVFSLEHDTRIWFDDHPNLETHRSYGRTTVSLFRPTEYFERQED